MQTKFIFIIALVLVSINSVKAQQTIYGSITHDDIDRDYILYVPDSYDENTAAPLMFCFHGYTSSATAIYTYTDFTSIADTAGFIVVYPQGSLLDGITHWNVGGWTLQSTADDVGFTDTLLDAISNSYNVNSERIYSTGMSNGGYMSFLLACQLSNKFAAVASVTGSMTPQMYDACNPQHPTPILQIHGTLDIVVPYEGAAAWTKSIDEVLEYWYNHNNCNVTPVTSVVPNTSILDGSTVEHITYEGGDNCTATEHFKISGGGHDWPGFLGNMDIDASIEVWKFLSQYDINGLIDCESNSLNETNSFRNEVRLFPNPVTDFVSIENPLLDHLNYTIYSNIGKVVLSGVINSNNNTIDLSGLPPSTYIIELGDYKQKLVKTN